MQDWSAQNFVQDGSLIGRGWLFGHPGDFLEKRLQNTRRSRVAAPADLEPPNGIGFGFG